MVGEGQDVGFYAVDAVACACAFSACDAGIIAMSCHCGLEGDGDGI